MGAVFRGEERILLAGAGGQGIMFASKVLAEAALLEGHYISWVPSYGAEVRGGTVQAWVTIAEREIANPLFTRPDTSLLMTQVAFDRVVPFLGEHGLIIADRSLIHEYRGVAKSIEVYAKKATEAAARLGGVKVANMILLGMYVAKRKSVKIKSVMDALRQLIPEDDKRKYELNREALYYGLRWGGK